MPFVATGTAGEKEKEIVLSQTRRYEKIPLRLHSIVYQPLFCVLLIEQDLLSVRVIHERNFVIKACPLPFFQNDSISLKIVTII